MRRSNLSACLRVLGFAAWLAAAACPVVAGEVSGVDAVAAPELRLADLDGAPVELDDYRGRVVLINFWASWCTPCLTEMPSLQRFAESMAGKPFALLTVNTGESAAVAGRAVRERKVEFPVLLDRDGDVFKQWGGKMLPTSFLLDRQGRVRYRILGDMEWDNDWEVDEILEALLRQD